MMMSCGWLSRRPAPVMRMKRVRLFIVSMSGAPQ
jgi:hypothetical protein